MATFHPNPDQDLEPWIERAVRDDLGFRVWHVMFFCLAAVMATVILVCCCIKIRVPRTKQEIEADYQRKKIASKFREKLKLIKNQEMDAMDLNQALEIIREDLRNENKNIEEQLSLQMNHDASPNNITGSMRAEPQQPPVSNFNSRLASSVRTGNHIN